MRNAQSYSIKTIKGIASIHKHIFNDKDLEMRKQSMWNASPSPAD